MTAPCHLCRRLFSVDEMGRDADGDFWCRDDECDRLARDRLGNPDSPWRLRREVARLEWRQNPPSVSDLFDLDADPMALFNLGAGA